MNSYFHIKGEKRDLVLIRNKFGWIIDDGVTSPKSFSTLEMKEIYEYLKSYYQEVK